ncbi:MAG: 30S ribosomal protein S15 [Deltaproteobacteria bacterium]|nr:30S ribosomal protein S15 [Deltaproteobacteria bacterium]
MDKKEKKKEIIKQFGKKSNDTGSAEVQIALLSDRIQNLTVHASSRKKDHASRKGLLGLVSQRRQLLNHLKDSNAKRYQKVVSDLGLRK